MATFLRICGVLHLNSFAVFAAPPSPVPRDSGGSASSVDEMPWLAPFTRKTLDPSQSAPPSPPPASHVILSLEDGIAEQFSASNSSSSSSFDRTHRRFDAAAVQRWLRHAVRCSKLQTIQIIINFQQSRQTYFGSSISDTRLPRFMKICALTILNRLFSTHIVDPCVHIGHLLVLSCSLPPILYAHR
jgi:hypothetical protein